MFVLVYLVFLQPSENIPTLLNVFLEGSIGSLLSPNSFLQVYLLFLLMDSQSKSCLKAVSSLALVQRVFLLRFDVLQALVGSGQL